MGREMMRTHIVIPKELVEEVDRLVGPRRRSEFFVDAATEKMARLKLREVARKLGGSLADKENPGWETSESAAEWVRSLRRESDEKRRSTS